MSDSPFTPETDEPLEARIVAWVLGDASAFEAAELERLCEERPDLLVFRRRIRALHGLLTEAEAAQPDLSWQLPAEKRRVLDEICGETLVSPAPAAPANATARQSRRKSRWMISALAACLVAMLVLGGLMTANLGGRKFAAVATAPKERLKAGIDITGGSDFAMEIPADRIASAPPTTADDRVPLKIDHPPETLGGKSKPMNVPGLVDNRAGPVIASGEAAPRSGDGAINGKSIDGVLAKRAPSEEEKVDEESTRIHRRMATTSDLAGHISGYTGTAAPSPPYATGARVADADGAIPSLSNIPAIGIPVAQAEPTSDAQSNGRFNMVDKMKEQRGEISSQKAGLAANLIYSLDPERTYGYTSSDQPTSGTSTLAERDVGRKPSNADDSIRTNAALDSSHSQRVDAVRRSLHTAEGAYQLGNYDQAKHAYEEVLRNDPYNTAARRGMETVAKAKSDYYRAAYDETRAEMLMEVDKAWETSIPTNAGNGGSTINEKLQHIIIPSVNFEDVTVEEALDFLSLRASELDTSATDPTAKGVLFSISKPTQNGRGTDASSHLGSIKIPSLRLENASLADALKSVCEKAGITAKVDTRGVTILPGTAATPAPPPTAPQPIPTETSAAIEPFSTFSLNISDASFKTAQAALAKGQRPDPATIRTEQFYNAMDFGDPYPSAADPVAARIEQSAHPFAAGRNLVRIALRTASAGRSAAQPLQLTVLIDQSGSMARADRQQALTGALAELATLLTPADRITVVGFALTPTLLADAVPGDQAAKLGALVNPAANEGGTNLESALKLAHQLASTRKSPQAKNRVVLFTDGAANLGDADPAHLSETIRHMRADGLAFDVAGIGTSELNEDLLGELARHGNGRFQVVDAASGPGELARTLAGAFRPAAENVKVQVRFNPARVGGYRLIGFEKDRLKKEDFRNDAVDAAELAAEEAGVALYQVQPLPEGEGDLGEVSIRFRDTATGTMVERSWCIPYDAGVAAFDQATPSMQLAGMALMCAEELRGGPESQWIDLTTFKTTRATLRQTYDGDRRVTELLEMTDKLR